jgi:hypothetical protein
MNGLDKEKFKAIEVGFSAQTTSMQTQEIIDNNLDRRKKGVYGKKSIYHLLYNNNTIIIRLSFKIDARIC